MDSKFPRSFMSIKKIFFFCDLGTIASFIYYYTLKKMEILIGKLGNQPFQITEPSVSRKHAILVVDDHTGQMILKDNGSANGTYVMVNGAFQRINQAKVGKDTVIRLGATLTFRVGELIKKKEPEAVDISKLRYIYETYNTNKMNLEAKAANVMMLRIMAMSGGGILSLFIFAFLPPDIVGDAQTTNIIKAAISLVFLIIAWFLCESKNKSVIRKRNENETRFKKKYCCPKCNIFLGNKIFENIVAEGRCPNPNCKCKFKIS